MSNVITAKDLTSPVQAAAQAVAPGSPAAQGNAANDLQAVTQVLKGVADIFGQVKGLVQEVKPIIEARIPKAGSDVLGNTSTGGAVSMSPTEVPSAKVIERVVVKKHDPEKIKQFLRFLIVEKKGSIPPEVLDMKIGDLLGDGFAKLQFHSQELGLDLNGDQILHILANGVASELDRMQEAS